MRSAPLLWSASACQATTPELALEMQSPPQSLQGCCGARPGKGLMVACRARSPGGEPSAPTVGPPKPGSPTLVTEVARHRHIN